MGRRTAQRVSEAYGNKPGEKGDEVKADAKPDKDLDDPVVQAEILNPMPQTIELEDGSNIVLHEPAAQLKRFMIGFTRELYLASAELRGNRVPMIPNPTEDQSKAIGAALTVRASTLLLGDHRDAEGRLYQDRLFMIVAEMFDKPGKLSRERIVEFAQELSAKATDDDIAKLLTAVLKISAIKNPKKQ